MELLLALHYWLLDWKNKETTHTLTLWQSWIIFFCCLDDHYKLPLCISAPLKNITIASSQKFDHCPSRNIFGVRDHLMHQHNSYKFDHCLYYLGYLWYLDNFHHFFAATVFFDVPSKMLVVLLMIMNIFREEKKVVLNADLRCKCFWSLAGMGIKVFKAPLMNMILCTECAIKLSQNTKGAHKEFVSGTCPHQQ